MNEAETRAKTYRPQFKGFGLKRNTIQHSLQIKLNSNIEIELLNEQKNKLNLKVKMC